MVCGVLWNIDPLIFFKVIFINGQTMLPPQDQALFGIATPVNDAPVLEPIANIDLVQNDEVKIIC